MRLDPRRVIPQLKIFKDFENFAPQFPDNDSESNHE
jgi:hypothetical protein